VSQDRAVSFCHRLPLLPFLSGHVDCKHCLGWSDNIYDAAAVLRQRNFFINNDNKTYIRGFILCHANNRNTSLDCRQRVGKTLLLPMRRPPVAGGRRL